MVIVSYDASTGTVGIKANALLVRDEPDLANEGKEEKRSIKTAVVGARVFGLSAVVNWTPETLRNRDHRLAYLGELTKTGSLRTALAGILREFVDDPEAVRILMKASRAIITGRAALSFGMHVMRHEPLQVPRELDIICPKTTFAGFAEALFEVLMNAQTPPKTCRDNYAGQSRKQHVLQTITFDLGRMAILVHCCSEENPLRAVMDQWGSHLLNAVSWDRFIMAYGELTLTKRAFVRARGLDANERQERAQDQLQNFEFRARANSYKAGRTLYQCDMVKCPRTRRWFGDPGCLVMNIYRLDKSATAEYADVKWSLAGEGCNDLCEQARCAEYADAPRQTHQVPEMRESKSKEGGQRRIGKQ
ncbi:hypothetical protein NLI96_g8690 [Meripilus lineatus]|uniref:Uncharacterized protein n=1 Tax=Meripilus lineatus TaxID=2056292 RepID=A0AAD5YG21_9APHY|nr:hypothetical protein NLI96_g8690 [Physisporinus lineatus]